MKYNPLAYERFILITWCVCQYFGWHEEHWEISVVCGKLEI